MKLKKERVDHLKTTSEILKCEALFDIQIGYDGGTCKKTFIPNKYPAVIVFSFGGGWDHVSMSFYNRCPTWEEMCWLKDTFFNEDETVIQFHPKKSEYVNNFPYTLHLWKKQGQEHELPPSIFVGIKE